MSNILGGTRGSAYLGTNANQPPNYNFETRDPNQYDFNGYSLGDFWINSTNESLWVLINLTGDANSSLAEWRQLSPLALTFVTGAGNVVPDATTSEVNIPNTTNILTTGVGNTLSINLNSNVVIPNGGSITVTPFGVGVVQSDVNGLLFSDAGTDGQILIGATGAAPAWANITSVGGTVAIANGANTINLEAVGVGAGALTFHTDTADALVLLASISILGGDNINTAGTNPGPTGVVTINLDQSPHVTGTVTADMGFIAAGGDVDIQAGNLLLPNTNAAGTQGVVSRGGTRFGTNLGNHNTFYGEASGNLTFTVANAEDNTGIGFQALASLVGTAPNDGDENTAVGSSAGSALTDGRRATLIGFNSGNSITTGDNNVGIGANSFSQLLTGSDNIAIGTLAGSDYTGAESSNITIGHVGVLADANTIRIGTQGNGAGQQDTTFIAGIYQSAAGATNEVVIVDSNGGLGSSKGTDGQLLIGSTAGSPAWATLTSGANIAIVNAGNSITISAVGGGGGGGITQVHTDGGNANIDAGDTSITIVGDGIIETAGAVHTVTVSLTNGANGQLLIGGGAAPAWANLTAGAGINIVNGANTITISAPGAGGGATTFITDTQSPSVVNAGNITMAGGDNINTVGQNGLGQIVTVNLDTAIVWPNTNVTGGTDTGMITLGGERFMHNYGTNNTWLGNSAGRRNASVIVANATDNTGIGDNAMNSITTAQYNTGVGSTALTAVNSGSGNTGIGYSALDHVTTGNSNVAVGSQALNGITSGLRNIAIGNGAGSNYTAGNSDNIAIGNSGNGGENRAIRIGTNGVQNNVYIAGSYTASTPIGTPNKVLLVDSNQHYAGTIGADAQFLITNNNAGTPSAQWATLSSSTLTITHPAPGSIVIENVTPVRFFAFSLNDANNSTGDGSVYKLGLLAAPLNQTLYNVGAAWNGGDGVATPARFTAPATGVYQFIFQVAARRPLTPPVPPPPPPEPPRDPMYITIYNAGAVQQRQFQSTNPFFVSQQGDTQTQQFIINTPMNATDYAEFSWSTLTDEGLLNITTLASSSVNLVGTWVTGSRTA